MNNPIYCIYILTIVSKMHTNGYCDLDLAGGIL